VATGRAAVTDAAAGRPDPGPDTPASAEAARIAEVYGRRRDAGRYSDFDPAHLLARQEVERALLGLLARAWPGGGAPDLTKTRALDVGCGSGQWLRRFLDWGVPPEGLHGVDVQPTRLAAARAALPAAADLRPGDAQQLPWPDGCFDLVSQFVVFSSVPDPSVRETLAREMARVTAPGGVILWYDFHVDNPRNPDVKGVGRSEIARLFPGFTPHLRRVTLAPPLARALLPRGRAVYELLRLLPALRTHWAGVLVRREVSPATPAR
jgi:SAM-dependent methyltransferase